MKTKIPPINQDAFIKEAIDIHAQELEAIVRQRLIDAVDDALHNAVLIGDIKPKKPNCKKRRK